MKIQKFNEDSSWMWEFDGLKIMVDPWFTPSQIDLHPLLSEQFHLQKQPDPALLDRPDFIFISHPFSDHCNKETLLQFDPKIPIIAKKSILNKIRKWQHFKELIALHHAPFKISLISNRSIFDPVHEAYLIESNNVKLLYAPHGSKVRVFPKVDIVITTTTTYRLPFWLGGTINLGLQNALSLKECCGARHLIGTHDEQKRGTGLVERLAKKNYPENSEGCIHLEVGKMINFLGGSASNELI